MAAAGQSVRERVERLDWYHTMDLGGGVVTPGWFDTRAAARKVPMPASLTGLRCLDVGTWDGFWAFEMERRGGTDVTAIDIDDQAAWDWPPVMRLARHNSGEDLVTAFKQEAAAFNLARETLASAVTRVNLSVYDLGPERVGTFDFVFLGSLLQHLRDPVAALAAVRSVCSGEAVIAEAVEFWPSVMRPRTPTARLEGVERPWWWQPNKAALHQMIRSAGFEILEATRIYALPTGPGHERKPGPGGILRGLASAHGREALVVAVAGIPHAAVRVRPWSPSGDE